MNPTQMIKSTLLRRSLACLALATATVSIASAAVTWHDVQFGGFASQGYIKSSANDYLGETSKGSFDFREYAVNTSYSFDKFRVGAQAFGQKIGPFGDDKIKLDWATVDYQATQWMGFRAGRVKMPRGLYNEALDLDAVRPYVLLPQSLYDSRLRDFNASFDGGMVYGNIELKNWGSLDYRVFYGDIPISNKSGAAVVFNNDVPANTVSIGMDSVRGGSLFWNPPVTGLKIGYSYSAFKNLHSLRAGEAYGTMIEFTKNTPLYERHQVSVEYTTGDWVFAAEAGQERGVSPLAVVGLPTLYSEHTKIVGYYASASRRLNKRWEIATYFSHSLEESQALSSRVIPTIYLPVFGLAASPPIGTALFPLPKLRQDDFALSVRYDVSDHIILKLEGHLLNGTGKIFADQSKVGPNPLDVSPLYAGRDNSWAMIAAKVTFVF